MYQRSLLKNTLLRMGKSRDASDTDEDNGYFRNLFGTGKKSKPSALNRNSQEESGTILNEPDGTKINLTASHNKLYCWI